MKDLIVFERSSNAETLGYILWLHLSRSNVLFSLGNEEVSTFAIILFLQVEHTRIGSPIKV